ncbi:efflux RND transporter periplasmic adaptor subunit [Paraglaciecola sp. L3A3]|uniref:efflux RND transporter periplasmic adaptor subunit n=1 Tax=Paraglaciecola sp. L3A3 TaxID=2686358 RepID=UPI00131C4880|nr:efflux RND transporter periplasmic adaptor subunit [Paraglaciecola sp. L3A3]
MKANLIPKIIAPIGAVAILLISIAWMAGLFADKIPPVDVVTDKQNFADTIQVSQSNISKMEFAPASLKARETTLISSRILARIEKINVRSGDQVSQGIPLIILENSALLSQVAQAKSRIGSLLGSMAEAKNALQRMQDLKQQGLASSAELDQAQALFTRLSGEIETAKQGQKEAETALAYSQIVAPISGTIVDRKAEPGNMATPGQPLLALYNPKSLRIEAEVREKLAIKLTLGQQLTVNIDSLNMQVPATISELVPAADPNAHSFVVKADIEFSEKLRPGMFARMQIPLEQESVILIPQRYVQSFGQLDRVWVVKDGQASRRFVRLGEKYDEQIEVLSGLEPEEIITATID